MSIWWISAWVSLCWDWHTQGRHSPAHPVCGSQPQHAHQLSAYPHLAHRCWGARPLDTAARGPCRIPFLSLSHLKQQIPDINQLRLPGVWIGWWEVFYFCQFIKVEIFMCCLKEDKWQTKYDIGIQNTKAIKKFSRCWLIHRYTCRCFGLKEDLKKSGKVKSLDCLEHWRYMPTAPIDK